ncbi:hypothetical protein PHSC3_001320 [Chlamydiales bacterium STE3]|nr:hypothetical protein PHSC3_001320 [Chlamydiales bacterium STE3]
MGMEELIGFLISLASLLFLGFKKIRGSQSSQETDDEEREQQERLKKFLKSLDIEMEEEAGMPSRSLPPSPPKKAKEMKVLPVQKPYQFSSDFDRYQQPFTAEKQYSSRTLHSQLEEKQLLYKNASDDYHMIQRSKPSKGKRVLSSLKSTKELVILTEILNRPQFF